uniref:Uncharacterized protein n=1 Tax=Fagus sylvatica TaxID=28930 RepID=A0A2N9H9G1_FAGSY
MEKKEAWRGCEDVRATEEEGQMKNSISRSLSRAVVILRSYSYSSSARRKEKENVDVSKLIPYSSSARRKEKENVFKYKKSYFFFGEEQPESVWTLNLNSYSLDWKPVIPMNVSRSGASRLNSGRVDPEDVGIIQAYDVDADVWFQGFFNTSQLFKKPEFLLTCNENLLPLIHVADQKFCLLLESCTMCKNEQPPEFDTKYVNFLVLDIDMHMPDDDDHDDDDDESVVP